MGVGWACRLRVPVGFVGVRNPLESVVAWTGESSVPSACPVLLGLGDFASVVASSAEDSGPLVTSVFLGVTGCNWNDCSVYVRFVWFPPNSTEPLSKGNRGFFIHVRSQDKDGFGRGLPVPVASTVCPTCGHPEADPEHIREKGVAQGGDPHMPSVWYGDDANLA